MSRAFAMVLVAMLAGCGTVRQASVGSSSASAPALGVAAPLPQASMQGAPPGISVYDASTYQQPSYTYPSTARILTGETPQAPPPGGVSARSDLMRR